MSQSGLVYLEVCWLFILVQSSICIDLGSPKPAWPLPTHNLFTLRLPLVSPRISAHHSTWLILNGSCKERCLFINTQPVLPVYCSHGNNHLLNKQLLCLPAWVGSLWPARGPRTRSTLWWRVQGFMMEVLGPHGFVSVTWCSYLCRGWSGYQDDTVVWSDHNHLVAPPPTSLHLPDGSDTVTLRALFADNM